MRVLPHILQYTEKPHNKELSNPSVNNDEVKKPGSRHTPALGPLYMLFPLPRKLCSRACARLSPSPPYNLRWRSSLTTPDPSLTTPDPVNIMLSPFPDFALVCPSTRLSAPASETGPGT